MGVCDGQNPQRFAKNQLVMNKVDGPSIIRPDGCGSIIARLGFHTPLQRIIAKQKA